MIIIIMIQIVVMLVMLLLIKLVIVIVLPTVRVSECKENDLSWDGGKGTRNGNDKYNSKRTGNGKGNNIGSYFRLDKDDNYGNGMVIGI